jgi:hypothetical protein
MFAGLRNSFSSLFDTSKFGLAKRNYIKKNSCNVSWIFFLREKINLGDEKRNHLNKTTLGQVATESQELGRRQHAMLIM